MVKVLRDVGLNYILLNPGSGVIHCSGRPLSHTVSAYHQPPLL